METGNKTHTRVKARSSLSGLLLSARECERLRIRDEESASNPMRMQEKLLVSNHRGMPL